MTNNEKKLSVEDYAQQLWDSFGDEKRSLIRFGMLPADDMHSAEALAYDGRELSVALMRCAQKDGGMRS